MSTVPFKTHSLCTPTAHYLLFSPIHPPFPLYSLLIIYTMSYPLHSITNCTATPAPHRTQCSITDSTNKAGTLTPSCHLMHMHMDHWMSPDSPTSPDNMLYPPYTDHTNYMPMHVKPLLEENPNHFVLFPIQHQDIWCFYKQAQAC